MDHPPRKRTNSSPISPSSVSLIRRRRFLIFTFLLVALIFFFGVPWELPAALKDSSLLSGYGLSRASFPALKTAKVEEIFGLLHFVTREDERQLAHSAGLDPTKPLVMGVYAAGEDDINWNKAVQKLNEDTPVLVFSKTYCPYSKQAKLLLEKYDLIPRPKIVEVDLRDDGDLIKHLLTRLTGRSTFPNIVVKGKTIGGSDTIQTLHRDGSLRQVFEKAGVTVQGEADIKARTEDILV